MRYPCGQLAQPLVGERHKPRFGIGVATEGLREHVGRTTHLKAQRLSKLEERLDPKRFVRVHRSFILNIDRLRSLELYAKDSRIAILDDGAKVPVSRSGYTRLRELL